MQLVTAIEEIKKLKSRDKALVKCQFCKKDFHGSVKMIRQVLKGSHRPNSLKYCGTKCQALSKVTQKKICCKTCQNEFYRKPSEIIDSRNSFCSRSCAASFNNRNKTFGTTRSKLEKWLEENLSIIFPNLEIHFNRKDAINSELDIYIPSLKVAFELNGLFHYEPIFGKEKLNSIQDNDQRKYQACLENTIELCIIDTSSQKYVKPKTSQKYLDIIVEIIERKLRN